MNPGRELDALVAERVMGLEVGWVTLTCWHPKLYMIKEWHKSKKEDISLEPGQPRFVTYSDGTTARSSMDTDYQLFGYTQDKNPIPTYSVDIAAAWEVVEKLIKDGHACDILFDHGWSCQSDLGHGRVSGDTAPHAICLAALKAVGVEV